MLKESSEEGDTIMIPWTNVAIVPLHSVEAGERYKACRVAYLLGNTPVIGFILPDMQPVANEDKPTVVVHGIIGGIPVPFHLPNADPCKDSGIKCPLKKKSTYIYSATLPVLPIYPKIKVDVKWELKSSTGKDFFCIQISALLE
ncbi:unnamed protein product [Darwinula stevensoni]|uniref:MD-2-related lipid-recognition domain-containing protein n=1 Tax=Darwinula stevensoni TaxID=69355 RepID=A0A7R8X674_9CRUS|nr:unnamed protein product [Darwinula stevensoni]CAG0885596.1 unnamed protein product [Darwinula stevensoni]